MECIDIERSIIKKYRKCLWGRFVRAINDYEMISEGDWGSEWNHWKRPNFSLDGTYEGKWYEDIKLKIDQEGCQVIE